MYDQSVNHFTPFHAIVKKNDFFTSQDRMSELAGKLQQKIKTFKKQIEDAEEIAALNLAKFRKAQQELEEAEERSKMAENQMSFSKQSMIGGPL